MSAPDLRALVEATPAEELPALAGRLREAELQIEMRIRSTAPAPAPAAEAAGNISIGEAARRLGVSPSYLYKNAKSLPFVETIGRRLVCSPGRLERWRARRSS